MLVTKMIENVILGRSKGLGKRNKVCRLLECYGWFTVCVHWVGGGLPGCGELDLGDPVRRAALVYVC